MSLTLKLATDKKVYFASDFHLGTPSRESSLVREKKLVRWLDMASKDAEAIFLLGDIFDFWFEYKRAVPKGFLRFQGRLAELVDNGINIYIFTGNHDMWMFDYFPEELNIQVFKDPIQLFINDTKLYIGHGDGLGPGDEQYKKLKKIFRNKLSQRAFGMLHPSIGIGVAQRWSQRSRLANNKHEEVFHGDKEHLLVYCKERETIEHHDYYIFGHRHLVLDLEVSENSRYLNPGDWVNNASYIVFDGKTCQLEEFNN
ncbi:MAG: UDP-2,3-diacylglucosamine diphosphatase [Bacteroidetes bacterium]|nr:MAG: UDP-2,3-diacylglucosamine diphosphatase [Bacteroidota bacterium]